MEDPVLRIPWPTDPVPPVEELTREEDPDSPLVTREWLVTNGLGGYASGTVATLATRRYHGLLVAALPAPLGRTMLIAHLTEVVRMPRGRAAPLAGKLTEFRLELGLPVWRYEVEGFAIERRVWMEHGRNTVFSSYELVGGNAAVEMELEPWIRFRPHDGALDLPAGGPYALQVVDDRYEIASDGYPLLRMGLDGGAHTFTIDRKRLRDVRYLLERARGYDSVGELYSPGFLRIGLAPGSRVTFFGSSEPWAALDPARRAGARSAEEARRRRLLAVAHPSARQGLAAHLVLAADQFLVAPAARAGGSAASEGAGTVIAGYHWFTDWGRDTMISLEGLTLVTGRSAEARAILRTFAGAARDGLIPNLFPEHGHEGLYHTADATLWFFHAIDRYLSATGDRETLRLLLPKLVEIVDRHVTGTRFGIGVDTRRAALARRAGLPADVDGREGRRLGRDASAWEGRRDQRALVQRALLDRAVARRRARRRGGRRLSRPRAARTRLVQPTLLVRTRRAPLRRRRRGERRRPVPSSQPDPGRVPPACGPRPVALGRRPRAGSVAAPQPVRASLPDPGGSRTTVRRTSAISARATWPITREPCGHGSSGPGSTRR